MPKAIQNQELTSISQKFKKNLKQNLNSGIQPFLKKPSQEIISLPPPLNLLKDFCTSSKSNTRRLGRTFKILKMLMIPWIIQMSKNNRNLRTIKDIVRI